MAGRTFPYGTRHFLPLFQLHVSVHHSKLTEARTPVGLLFALLTVPQSVSCAKSRLIKYWSMCLGVPQHLKLGASTPDPRLFIRPHFLSDFQISPHPVCNTGKPGGLHLTAPRTGQPLLDGSAPSSPACKEQLLGLDFGSVIMSSVTLTPIIETSYTM